ncbi:leukocyte surface antigen CD53-like [Tribolium madens]|uniref:leukocyte surface antigen CD53-like n=1 Tax=Tribolium madens TaxID=41895 RepID=UPI001CF7637E|nr:leukocyte surface antigen CD53-like [Tribolium madens]
MACYKSCRKWTVIIFNLIFLIVGLVLVASGTFWKIRYNNLHSIIPSTYSYYTSAPLLLIILGSITVIVSLFGSLGVWRKNPPILTTHTIILIVFFILQIILSTVSFWVLSQDNLKENVYNNVNNIYKSDNNTELINFIQEELKCCGPTGITSIKNLTILPDIIKSCYKNHDTTTLAFADGCKKAVYNFIILTIRGIGTTILGLAPLEVVGATLSLSLANAIRNQRRRYGKYLD